MLILKDTFSPDRFLYELTQIPEKIVFIAELEILLLFFKVLFAQVG